MFDFDFITVTELANIFPSLHKLSINLSLVLDSTQRAVTILDPRCL